MSFVANMVQPYVSGMVEEFKGIRMGVKVDDSGVLHYSMQMILCFWPTQVWSFETWT